MPKVLSILTLSIAFSLLFCTSIAYAWPWGDSSKYRNECYQACVEDSFGRAKANEINQRCENKCGSLPTSPRVQWGDYDHCISFKKESYEKMVKSEPTRASCAAEITRQQSRDCMDAAAEKIFYDFYKNKECKTPSVPRPNNR